MARYANAVPNDVYGNPIQGAGIPVTAIATIVSENAVVSSVITVNDNTTDIEVTAVGSTGFLKWITRASTNPSVIAAAGTANFDVVIPSGTARRLVIPRETGGAGASVVGANIQNGLYNRYAYITAGIGSILSNQY